MDRSRVGGLSTTLLLPDPPGSGPAFTSQNGPAQPKRVIGSDCEYRMIQKYMTNIPLYATTMCGLTVKAEGARAGAPRREGSMAAEMRVTRLEAKSHDTPDEVRSPKKTKVEVVHLKEFTLGRFKLDAGWKWSDCIQPVVKTDSCQ